MTTGFWNGKRVLITGHTGFKGGWLALWLHARGARVHGYALPPTTSPSLFEVARVESALESSTIGDIRDYETLEATLRKHSPEIVLHLAAQSLVRRSYEVPVETYATNVLGTVHLLEAARHVESVRVVVNVTSDKCYDNREWVWGYRENEPMGGRDPYSSSKGCAELVTAAYRDSFLSERGVQVASARAGNVIGGGDFAVDRLLPDFFRAHPSGKEVFIRHPGAVRPWQHVLEPLSGYILLAERLAASDAEAAGAWNFGPPAESERDVRWVIDYVTRRAGSSWRTDTGSQPHEAHHLSLDSSKARALLGWRPQWALETALDKTMDWHDAWKQGADMQAFTLSQITEYEAVGARVSETSTPK